MDNPKLVEEKFTKYQKSLVTQSSDLSLQSIADMVESGAIDISPKYQRRDRWSVENQSELIESFLLNIPVPPVYLAEDEYGTYSVIDGKQRVTAISRFMNNKLKLKGLEKFIDLEGRALSDLPDSLANALKIRPYLRVVTLLQQSDPDLKHEVFLRLNKSGVALNAQEIRNVAYRGHFNDMLFVLADAPFLKKQLKISLKSKIYSEMQDVQFVLRFFTVLDCWKNFPGNMDRAMDSYMKKNYKLSQREVDKNKSLFLNTLDICQKIWGSEAFMKPDGNRRVLQGFYDIQMVGVALLNNQERQRLLENKKVVKSSLIKAIANDEKFEESISQFTSNSERMRFRITKVLEVFKNI